MTQFKYYMFNKPFGYITANRDPRKPVIMEFFPQFEEEGLFPVGRLDRETEGLLFITNDGQWSHKMMHPDFNKEKRYEFTVLGDLTDEKKKVLEEGVLLTSMDEKTAPCKISIKRKCCLEDVYESLHSDIQSKEKSRRRDYPVTIGEIVITEGKKRQIRRMMRYMQCTVLRLKRVEIAGIVLDESLEPGAYRPMDIENERVK